MVLGGAFLYATSNVLQEYLLSEGMDMFSYLGFLGLFGTAITAIESIFFFQEFTFLQDLEAGEVP